jgi:hypothetical protein
LSEMERKSELELEKEKALRMHTSATAKLARAQQEKKRLERLEKEEKEKNTCKVCCAAPINTVFVPCGHIYACQPCAEQCVRGARAADRKCPVCRRGSTKVVVTYTS